MSKNIQLDQRLLKKYSEKQNELKTKRWVEWEPGFDVESSVTSPFSIFKKLPPMGWNLEKKL